MSTVEEKIINATVGSIEKYGIKNTTIRQIGKEAGVNSASISYYFRSKDVLMKHVMKVALSNAFDLGNFESTHELPVKERLIIIMDGLIAGALQYPNITRSFFSDLFHSDSYDFPVVQSFNEFIVKLEGELEAAYPDIPGIDIRMILMQVTSSTFLFLGLFPGFYSGYPEINLSDPKIRRAYVEKLINKLL